MENRNSFFIIFAKKLSSRLGKPSAIVAMMAFLFIWAVIGLFADVPMTVSPIATVVVLGLTLLRVHSLQNAYEQDIRTLQARIEALSAEWRRASESAADSLTESELQQVRDLLQRSSDDDCKRRSDRDRRPSLF